MVLVKYRKRIKYKSSTCECKRYIVYWQKRLIPTISVPTCEIVTYIGNVDKIITRSTHLWYILYMMCLLVSTRKCSSKRLFNYNENVFRIVTNINAVTSIFQTQIRNRSKNQKVETFKSDLPQNQLEIIYVRQLCVGMIHGRDATERIVPSSKPLCAL